MCLMPRWRIQETYDLLADCPYIQFYRQWHVDLSCFSTRILDQSALYKTSKGLAETLLLVCVAHAVEAEPLCNLRDRIEDGIAPAVLAFSKRQGLQWTQSSKRASQ